MPYTWECSKPEVNLARGPESSSCMVGSQSQAPQAGVRVQLAVDCRKESLEFFGISKEWKTIDDVLMHVEGALSPRRRWLICQVSLQMRPGAVLPLPPGVLCPRLHPMERRAFNKLVLHLKDRGLSCGRWCHVLSGFLSLHAAHRQALQR